MRTLSQTHARAATPDYEVQRILIAFVDAQWLADLDERLAAYQAHLAQTDDSSD